MADLSTEERLRRLLRHLGVRRAHLAGRTAPQCAAFVRALPETVASLTLVCPGGFEAAALRPLGSRLLLVHGDRGPGAGVVPRARPGLPDAVVVTLAEHVDLLWGDTVAERADEVGGALAPFLASVAALEPIDEVPLAEGAGEVEEISYLVRGAGPPLLLLPLGLAPSQWEPLVPALRERYCTITLGGAHVGILANLEQRARGGHLDVVRAVVEEMRLAPGERVLEVGCGTGAVVRWLARRTGGANPIVAVDLNPYLLREAAALARRDGLDDRIELRAGNAESLPFPDASFDATLSVTVMEEGDADRMLAELIRVTRPGGRVGVVVRATDMPAWVNLPLRPELRSKVENAPGPGAAARGCADASLYRRIRTSGLARVKTWPQLASHHPDYGIPDFRTGFESSSMAVLTADEAAEWRAAVVRAESEGTFLWATPCHCAVGTRA